LNSNPDVWSNAQAGRILSLAEASVLTPDELHRAAEFAPLSPARSAWRAAADRLLAFAGVLLLAVGMVFFFAYNWADLHRFVKFGLAWFGLAACVGAGMLAQPYATGYRAALSGAAFLTGALLALIGQTYQTGADVWELFAAWLALMTPFVLLARSTAAWGLWAIVANLALGRYLFMLAWLGFPGWFDEAGKLLTVAVFNLSVLAVFEALPGQLLALPRRYIHRLLALLGLAPLVVGAVIGWWDGDFISLIAAFLLVCAVLIRFYRVNRRDVPILAMAVFSSIAVLTAGVVKLLSGGGFVAYNLIALFIIVCSGYAAVWLTRLYRQGDRA
jgi:uncharacterized membrane protein